MKSKITRESLRSAKDAIKSSIDSVIQKAGKTEIESELYSNREFISIEGSETNDPKDKRLIFFLCPYGTQIWQFKILINSFNNRGYDVIAYDFSTSNINGHPKSLPALISQVVPEISEKIKNSDSYYQEIGVIGLSLGSFIAYKLITETSKIDWAILGTGGNTAEAAWRIIRVRLRHSMMSRTLLDLMEAWANLTTPEGTKIKAKKVLCLGSPKDPILPFSELRDYVGRLDSSKTKLKFMPTKGSSHTTAVINIARDIDKYIRIVRHL